MSDYSEWTEQRREYGWFGRMIAPRDGGRPATLAFTVGVLGAVAFAASLFLNWHTVTVDLSSGGNTDAPSATASVVTLSVQGPGGSGDTPGLVYMLGVVACLGAWGAVVARPELALRLRLAVAGVGAGLLAVVVALILRRPDSITAQALLGGFPNELESRIKTAYEPGAFLGLVAVILPVVAIWLAGQPAARAQMAEQVEAPAERAAVPDVDQRQWAAPSKAGGAFDLTVTPGGDAWPT
jgi:hypothetical protein